MADPLTTPAHALDALDVLETTEDRALRKVTTDALRDYIQRTSSRSILETALEQVRAVISAIREELAEWRQELAQWRPAMTRAVDVYQAEGRRQDAAQAREEARAGVLTRVTSVPVLLRILAILGALATGGAIGRGTAESSTASASEAP